MKTKTSVKSVRLFGIAGLLVVMVISMTALSLTGCPDPSIDPGTGDGTPITIKAVGGVTAPVAGGQPVTAVTETAQYKGSVSWFPAVQGTFSEKMQYMATITLTAKDGYTLTGVAGNFFTVAGATANNAANSGVITAVFPTTAGTSDNPAVIDIAEIEGVTAPVTGGHPVTTVTETAQYTGSVSWFPAVHGTFGERTHYMATITLTAKNGYTLTGVDEDFFTVAEATANNAANSGVVTAVFPTTAGTSENPAVIDIEEIEGVTFPENGGQPSTAVTETAQYTGSVSWFPAVNGTFKDGTQYMATITLTAKNGYSFTGVAENFFTVAGATANNEANSGIVTAVFPVTGEAPVYGISISVTGTYSFGTAAQGYTSASPVLPVIITNTGNLATGPLTVSLSGAGADAFTLSTVLINGIIAEGMSSFSVRRKAALTEGVYEATITVSGGNGITAAFDVQFIVAALPYVITGSGNEFTATRGSDVIGTAGQPIQNIINGIRADADGGIAAIQFGEGDSALDIGVESITFSDTTEEEWGTVTLFGKITSSVSAAAGGTVIIANPVSITSTADIANTAVTNGRAIYNNSTGAVNITGGTVSATTGVAAYNASAGKITVSGTAKVTSANVTVAQGTILIANSGTATDPRLEISGGTVENTGANSTNAAAVYNASSGAVNVSGGVVSVVSTGRAIYNSTTGMVRISGGTVSSELGYAVINSGSGSKLTISGGTVSSEDSNAVYNSSTSAAGGIADISGGTITSISATAVLNYSTGTLNVSGGTVSSRTAPALRNESTGKITVSGDALITSRNKETTSTNNPGTIFISSTNTATNVLLEISGGRVENTGNGFAVYQYSLLGVINISGGTISATTNHTVATYYGGPVNISGGTISSTTGRAVSNGSTGHIDISGGTISSATGYALHNGSTGKITVRQSDAAKPTLITSANADAAQGTVYIASSGTATADRLEITGGTVQNTSTGANGNAVYNGSTGGVNISGGTISTSATAGRAIFNNVAAVVIITNGTILAPEAGACTVWNVNNTTSSVTITKPPTVIDETKFGGAGVSKITVGP
jgi:hypothetical protein